MNRLSMEKQVKVLRMLTEGCSIRSTEKLTGHHRDTITRLLQSAGEQARMGYCPILVLGGK